MHRGDLTPAPIVKVYEMCYPLHFFGSLVDTVDTIITPPLHIWHSESIWHHVVPKVVGPSEVHQDLTSSHDHGPRDVLILRSLGARRSGDLKRWRFSIEAQGRAEGFVAERLSAYFRYGWWCLKADFWDVWGVQRMACVVAAGT